MAEAPETHLPARVYHPIFKSGFPVVFNSRTTEGYVAWVKTRRMNEVQRTQALRISNTSKPIASGFFYLREIKHLAVSDNGAYFVFRLSKKGIRGTAASDILDSGVALDAV